MRHRKGWKTHSSDSTQQAARPREAIGDLRRNPVLTIKNATDQHRNSSNRGKNRTGSHPLFLPSAGVPRPTEHPLFRLAKLGKDDVFNLFLELVPRDFDHPREVVLQELPRTAQSHQRVDLRLPGKGCSHTHGARTVC